MKISELKVELLEWTPTPEQLIEIAARTCYKSEGRIGPGTAEKLIKACIKRGHMSVFEHASATVRIICDRGVSHEVVRHRLASFSQESTRYCAYQDGIELIPMHNGLTAAQIERRMALYLHSQEVYLAELAEGIKPQQARDCLLTCLKTEIVMTANFREWRDSFLRLRNAPAAHPQIQKVAKMIQAELERIAPTVFAKETTS